MLSKKAGAFIAVLLTTALLFLYYHHDILHANSLAYGAWGDGYKNFYTLAYYVKYDAGTHFTGMNYPNGENILFTDNQPVLAFVLKYLAGVFPFIKNYLHAIVVGLLFITLIVSSAVMYRLLVKLKVTPLLASILATFIIMMSPNWDHFLGLYSLAYTLYFPLLLYFSILILLNEDAKRHALLGGLVTIVFSFIHLYFLAIALFFIVGLCFTLLVFNYRQFKPALQKSILLGLMILVPIILVKIYLFVTDTVTDRPLNPWGYLAGYTHFYYIVLHPQSFLYFFIKDHFPELSKQLTFGYDAKCYIGVSAVVLLIISVFIVLKVWVNKHRLDALNRVLLILFLASIPVLLFAMAIPFKYKYFAGWYDAMPGTLKQFRASARFSWIFYYTATIGAAVGLNNLYHYLLAKNKTVAGLVLSLFIAIWFIDVNTTNAYQAQNFKLSSNQVNEYEYAQAINDSLTAKGYFKTSFQAILPLPYYHVGSEKISIQTGANFGSMQLSLATGLPLLSCQMSRTSVSQTFKVINLLSDTYIKKDIANLLPDKRPLLLMFTGSGLNENEKRLLEKATPLFNYAGYRFFVLPLWAFNDSCQLLKTTLAANLSDFKKSGNYSSTDTTNRVVSLQYDAEINAIHLFGRGAHSISNHQLYKHDLPNALDNSNYEISVWFYVDAETNMPSIKLTQFDSSGTNQISEQFFSTSTSSNTYGNWIRWSIPFTLANRKNIICLTVNPQNVVFDELLIRPADVNVITHYNSPNSFVWNNYPIY